MLLRDLFHEFPRERDVRRQWKRTIEGGKGRCKVSGSILEHLRSLNETVVSVVAL